MADISSKYLNQEMFDEENNPDPSDDSSRKLLDSADDISSHKTQRRIRRRRRSIEANGGKLSTQSTEPSLADTDSGFLSELNCGLTQCTFISCVIGPLRKREFTLFTVKSRLWVRTLNEIQRNDIEISSKLVSRVTKLPYGVNPSYLGYQTHVVTTQVRLVQRTPLAGFNECFHVGVQVLAHDLPSAGNIPLWILILAILAGFLFLSLLTFILYKLGFFQRKRPEDYDYQGTIQVG